MTTSLNTDMKTISSIMKKGWQIENSFRVIKTSFKSKPVYHQKYTRIVAHFAICFLALLTFEILKKLINHYTINNLIKQLQIQLPQFLQELLIQTIKVHNYFKT